ncbi:hypothetical protein NJC38_17180 [Pseudomonas sp. 21LCFQ010]|uniref:hypothetical protein n=1 Tax=Pseudomonas sp. 21LCFQ010 TaxID=2957506 RepID=UPI0020978009|nr:hypothetical protein [Pseudomonas sp. 21LCFQ010]MCO8163889.1 hypothetical protein [Pseudomonas sp. 21LCFQ010]
MPNAEEKVREKIRQIGACLYTDLVDEASSTAWGYLQALLDFDIISDRQYDDLNHEINTATQSIKAKLEKKGR